ncbi:hypothetical protein [Embleya sp. NPDC001921]
MTRRGLALMKVFPMWTHVLVLEGIIESTLRLSRLVRRPTEPDQS